MSMRRMRDEIKIVEHLSTKLKDNLKGNTITHLVNTSPQANILAGVLFPREMFERVALPGQDVDDEDGKEIKRMAVPLSKNCSIGLDFLAKPEVDKSKLELFVDCSFDIYIRVFPTFKEQLIFINNGTIDANEADEEEKVEQEQGDDDSEAVENTNSQSTKQEYPLIEKYEKISVTIENVPAVVTLQDNEEVVISQHVGEEIDKALRTYLSENRSRIYAAKSKNEQRADKKIGIQGPWDTETEFLVALHAITAESYNLPKWQAELNIKILPQLDPRAEVRRVNIILSNTTPFDFKPDHPQELYNCFIKIKTVNSQIDPFYFENVQADYRYDTRFKGLGINCTALEAGENTIKSETIPSFFQDWFRTRDQIPASFEDLKNSPFDILKKVSIGLNDWRSEWKDYISFGYKQDGLTDEQLEQCKQDLKSFEEEISGFELGFTALKQDERLLQAFQLMNLVFEKAGQGKYTTWRLFQLVFIVRLLPSLAARENNDPRFAEELSKADILWFPTGGGKTEAYLGLIVCSLFFDRLRGKMKGTTAWLRFPLRMLSKQQLDRLAKVLAIAEEIRSSSMFPTDKKGEPFSMGYFVGSGNTPNFISSTEMRSFATDEKLRNQRIQLHKFPFCSAMVKMEVDQEAWRLIHKCSNDSCHTNTDIGMRQSLPLYITDSEIYRYLPSVICGTVDKLAILGRYGEFSHIFGQVTGHCPKHGYLSGGTCIERRLGSKSCNINARSYTKIQPEADPTPSLLIQDELHLLKEELGVFDGHYEGFIQEISRKVGAGKQPKVLAATATIEAYELHIRHLYGKDPQRYPVPSYRNGESFYATSTPKIPRRIYLGLLSHLKASEETIARCLRIYHEAINELFLNPMKAIATLDLESFNNADEFLTWLAYYDLSTVYVNQKTTGFNIDDRIQRILNPLLLETIGYELNSVVLTGNEDMAKIGSVIDQIEKEKEFAPKDKLHSLIATSLISHGVDLERINAFLMAGMPSKTAEYIQASSRSARSHAGLVLVCFNAKELRERSQYVYFVQNHKFQDKLVEPVPINRLATYAFEKTIPGLLCGLFLGVYSRLLWPRYKSLLETAGEVRKVLTEENTRTDQLLTEEKIVEDLCNIIGINKPYYSITSREEAKKSIERVVDDLLDVIRRAPNDTKLKDELVLSPITSFRDVDEGVDFTPSPDSCIIAANIRF